MNIYLACCDIWLVVLYNTHNKLYDIMNVLKQQYIKLS